ncbi:unnamed protein product [Soboliphyme baturini]|uniref:Secreted protein n=1 Tax=Soboliphyme baturini TaxID=241478 RepID=A0A183J0E2_9BILA|nr:unnamed protein product [Soboliphyme baturini]
MFLMGLFRALILRGRRFESYLTRCRGTQSRSVGHFCNKIYMLINTARNMRCVRTDSSYLAVVLPFGTDVDLSFIIEIELRIRCISLGLAACLLGDDTCSSMIRNVADSAYNKLIIQRYRARDFRHPEQDLSAESGNVEV